MKRSPAAQLIEPRIAMSTVSGTNILPEEEEKGIREVSQCLDVLSEVALMERHYDTAGASRNCPS